MSDMSQPDEGTCVGSGRCRVARMSSEKPAAYCRQLKFSKRAGKDRSARTRRCSHCMHRRSRARHISSPRLAAALPGGTVSIRKGPWHLDTQGGLELVHSSTQGSNDMPRA